MQRSSKALNGPVKTSLKVLEMFIGTFKSNITCCKLHMCVLQDFKTNLLGLPLITALNFIARIQVQRN